MEDLYPAIIEAVAILISSSCGCISTVIITLIGGGIITSIISKQESRREFVLSQQNPSYPSYFNDTRKYIKLMGKLKRDMLDFYYNNPRRGLKLYDKAPKLFEYDKLLAT